MEAEQVKDEKVMTGFRLLKSEIKSLDVIAAEDGVTRSDVMRKAITNYRTYRKSEKNLQSRAEDIYKKSIAKHESHPIMVRIANQGIDVRDKNGNRVATIRSLTELLDFVDKKVFNYGNV